MLLDTLRLLATGQVQNQIDLAERLNVSEALVVQMLQTLAFQGYLVPTMMGGGCTGCAACHGSQPCCPPGRSPETRGWLLTPKGIEAADRSR
jgi:hypothetical protein